MGTVQNDGSSRAPAENAGADELISAPQEAAARTDGTGYKRSAARIGIFFLVCVAVAATLAPLVFPGGRREYDAQSLYAASADAVFYLRTLDGDGKLKASGSGFAIDREGLALTASHVLRGGAAVYAVLPDGEELPVEILDADDETDVAVLRRPARETPYPALRLKAEAPLSGAAVYALGYPLKNVKLIAGGLVSAPEAEINGTPRMLLSANLASGMSGGPVLCADGAVAGISSATLKTMNGVSASPTTGQILDAVERNADRKIPETGSGKGG